MERNQVIEKSMEPTILSGEVVKIDREAYRLSTPQPGEIVEVRAPVGVEQERCGVRIRRTSPCPRATPGLSDILVIKRIVAVGGDRVAIGPRGEAIVNGRRTSEPYVQACAPAEGCAMPRAIRVPEDHYFLLGDNRPYSSDSRYWGPVPLAAIEGLVTPPDPSRR